jgi:hypothetical protein
MIRESHRYRFQLGPGWSPTTKTECYYERCEELPTAHRPYTIKIVGVTCDPAVAGKQALTSLENIATLGNELLAVGMVQWRAATDARSSPGGVFLC